jgi:hypothetical protein
MMLIEMAAPRTYAADVRRQSSLVAKKNELSICGPATMTKAIGSTARMFMRAILFGPKAAFVRLGNRDSSAQLRELWPQPETRMGPPKSGKGRSVPLVDQAAAALDRLSRRNHWTGQTDLVFVNATGDHLERSTMRRRYVKALDRAGLKRIRFHDLRHTFGTLAVQASPLSDVKAYMGHADISTTMRYVHHVPQHDAAARLTRLLRERSEAELGCAPGARSGSVSEGRTHEIRPKQRFRGLSTRARTSRPRTSSPGTTAGRRPSSGGPC